MLFVRDSREDINEARQFYLLAPEILGERPTLPAQEPPVLTANALLGRYRIVLDDGLPFDPLDLLASMLPTTGPGACRAAAAAPGAAGPSLFEPESICRQHSGGLPTTTTPAQGGVENFNTLLLFCLPANDLLYGSGILWPIECSRSGTA